MSFALSPVAANEGYRLETFEAVGSTNAVALERAAGGDPGKLWLVTKKQESGRGRRGRAWSTPEGNLASTLLLVESYEMKTAATLGFVAGLSLADALDAVFAATGPAVPPTIGLKWPNDVLVNGAKLTGILLESSILAKNLFAVAIGIGTNVVAFPDDRLIRQPHCGRSAANVMLKPCSLRCRMRGRSTIVSGTRGVVSTIFASVGLSARMALASTLPCRLKAALLKVVSRRLTRLVALLFARMKVRGSR